jgi:hypothetical protein
MISLEIPCISGHSREPLDSDEQVVERCGRSLNLRNSAMRYTRATLWSLFVVLLIASGVRLLWGCAITVPVFLHLQYCPVEH